MKAQSQPNTLAKAKQLLMFDRGKLSPNYIDADRNRQRNERRPPRTKEKGPEEIEDR